MKRSYYLKIIYSVFLTVIITQISIVLAQETITIGLGSMSKQISDIHRAEGAGGVNYPREYQEYTSATLESGDGVIISARNFDAKWYYPQGRYEVDKPDFGWTYVGEGNPPVTIPYVALDATTFVYQDRHHTTVPVRLERVWSQTIPKRIVDGVDYSINEWNPYDIVDENLFCEQIAISETNTLVGITHIQRAYAFANPEYDDFIIVENIFKNTGDIDSDPELEYPENKVQDCYVGVKTLLCPTGTRWGIHSDDWVDYYGKTYEQWASTGVGDSLRILYGWDGDAAVTSISWDDEGDPLPASGLFLSPQYPGLAVLHADKSTTDHSDDPKKPNLSYYSRGGGLTETNISVANSTLGQEGIWNTMNDGGYFPSPFKWDDWYESQIEIWDPQTGFGGDVSAEFRKTATMGFGPYQFENMGDSVRIVICYAAGTISWDDRIEYGKKWKEGTISKIEKNLKLRSARKDLFDKASWVRSLFKKSDGSYDFNMTKGSTIDQKIASPPKWPDLIITSEVRGIQIEWSDESADGYRVYKRLKPDFYADDPGPEAYQLVYEASGNVFEWKDEDVTPGQHYWFAVTAVKNGIESSKFINKMTPSSSEPFRESASPYSEPPTTLDNVTVVPNPYHVSATRLYNWPQDQINFVGLPAGCRIRIYTQTGDLITTIDHKITSPPSSVESWLQITDSNQFISSGLYIYIVDRAKSYVGDDLGLTKVGKFSVIR